jgi:hypothetical protein
MHEPSGADAPVTLGSFAVSVTADEVGAFCVSLDLPTDIVPLTYPVCFLARPEIASAVRRNLLHDGVFIHRSQSFRARAPLEIGHRYRLDLKCSSTKPRHATIHGEIFGAEGAPVQDFTAILMLLGADEKLV